MRIWLDATATLHGERAVRRNTRNLLAALIARPQARYGLLYFDRTGSTPGRLTLPPGSFCTEVTSRWPLRLLLPGWRWLGEPSVTRFVGALELLYAPDLYFPPAERSRVLCTIRGIAYLVHGELLDQRTRQSLTQAFAYARRRSDDFLAVSESTRRDLLDRTDIPADRIHVVTHGVDPHFSVLPKEQARQAVRRRFGLERPYLLHVGVVARHKNIHGLLAAFARIAEREPHLDLALAGPEEMSGRDALNHARSCPWGARVHVLGNIPPDDGGLRDLYNAAEMLVFPSFYEGWPAPPLEAMACGTPVIGSNIPAVAEAVGEAGVLAPPDDAEALAAAVLAVLKDGDLRQTLIKKGLERSALQTWSRAAERLEAIFTAILNRA